MTAAGAQSTEQGRTFRTAGLLPLSCDLQEGKACGSQKEQ